MARNSRGMGELTCWPWLHARLVAHVCDSRACFAFGKLEGRKRCPGKRGVALRFWRGRTRASLVSLSLGQVLPSLVAASILVVRKQILLSNPQFANLRLAECRLPRQTTSPLCKCLCVRASLFPQHVHEPAQVWACMRLFVCMEPPALAQKA